MRNLLMAIAVATIALAGCVDDEPTPPADPEPPVEEPPYAQVVVAVIDSGTNPYHDHFRGDIDMRALEAIREAGGDFDSLAITLEGTYDERMQADQDLIAGMGQGQLYHFDGTRVLGISFGSSVPVWDDAGSSHGTATTGAVLDANPEAIVVMVEGDYDQAEAWVAQQPWIDVSSMSYGPPGSIPVAGPTIFGFRTHEHTQTAWNNGKIPVGAADNSPSLAPNDSTAGPPWVIGVAGDHPEDHCREHISGTFPDFTADFRQTLPNAYDVSEYHETQGTSFSTPATAGTASAVIQGVRAAWNHTGGIVDGNLAVGPDGQTLTNQDVRDALARTAYYFDFAACNPGITQLPVNPAAPWLQMGWGHVGPEIINETVDHLLGIETAPAPDVGATSFQTAMMSYREALWSLHP